MSRYPTRPPRTSQLPSVCTIRPLVVDSSPDGGVAGYTAGTDAANVPCSIQQATSLQSIEFSKATDRAVYDLYLPVAIEGTAVTVGPHDEIVAGGETYRVLSRPVLIGIGRDMQRVSIEVRD